MALFAFVECELTSGMPQFDSSGDTSGPPRLDEQLDAFVRQSLGVTEFSAEWCGWDHGEARVWRLDFATCDNVRARVFLKAWRNPENLHANVEHCRNGANH